jgi:hypothetical protein
MLVHPSNRFGTGLYVKDVHSILDDVSSTGWDPEMVGVPACFEISFGDAGEKAVAINERIVAASQGFLAPVNRSLATDLSVGASHRTAALRCVKAGARHEPEKRIDAGPDRWQWPALHGEVH